MDALATIVRRRDKTIRLARTCLMTAFLLWFLTVAFYDISFDHPQRINTILISISIVDLLMLAKVNVGDVGTPMWGGPINVFGLQSFAFTAAFVAMIAFVRARLNHGTWSRIGLVLLPLSIAALGATVVEIATFPHPQSVEVRSFDRVRAAVERIEPRLIARLEAGERPMLPAGSSHKWQLFSPDGVRLQVMRKPGEPWLESRDQEAALRFALAQQALAQGDREKLQRLLPISFQAEGRDLAANTDFARRLAMMQTFAGMPSVPPSQAEWIEVGAARWQAFRILGLTMRKLMQACLLIGLISAAIAFAMRRRVRRLHSHLEALDRAAAT
jgi:hypothetical protein